MSRIHFYFMLSIQVDSRRHRFLPVCNTHSLAMPSTSGNSKNIVGMQELDCKETGAIFKDEI